LTESQPGKKEKWVFYRCNETGHRAHQSNSKVNKNKGKPNLHCNHCGKFGHIASNCWFTEENKDKRPEGFREKFKNKGEKVNMAKDLEETKESLLGMTDGNTIDEHIASNCRFKVENKDKRPEGFREKFWCCQT
jgi:hypothetical protein